MIKNFSHKVEEGTETVSIHWIVDDKHFERELSLAGAGLGFKKAIGGFNAHPPEGSVLRNLKFFNSLSYAGLQS